MPGTIDDVSGSAKGLLDEWLRETDAQLEALRKRAKARAEGVMRTRRDAERHLQSQVNGQNRLNGRAKDAWGRFEEAVRQRKEEAERLHDAQQLNDGGDLDPVVQSGCWFDESHSSCR
jgi:hypothetical protein